MAKNGLGFCLIAIYSTCLQLGYRKGEIITPEQAKVLFLEFHSIRVDECKIFKAAKE